MKFQNKNDTKLFLDDAGTRPAFILYIESVFDAHSISDEFYYNFKFKII